MAVFNEAGAFEDIEGQCVTVHRIRIDEVRGKDVRYNACTSTSLFCEADWMLKNTVTTINKAIFMACMCTEGVIDPKDLVSLSDLRALEPGSSLASYAIVDNFPHSSDLNYEGYAHLGAIG